MLFGIPQPHAPDVAPFPTIEVESAEGQTILDFVELRNAVLVEAGESVPFAARLVCASDGAALNTLELPARIVAKGIQTCIKRSDVVAFSVELR
jgi:hypothetical protein